MFASLRRTDIIEVKVSSAADEWRHVVSINNSTLTDLIRNPNELSNGQLNKKLAKDEVFPAFCIMNGGATIVVDRPFQDIVKDNLTQMIQQARQMALMGGLTPLQVDTAFYAAVGKAAEINGTKDKGEGGSDGEGKKGNKEGGGIGDMLDSAVDNGCPMS